MNRYTRAIALTMFVPDMVIGIVEEYNEAIHSAAEAHWRDGTLDEEVMDALRRLQRGDLTDASEHAVYTLRRMSAIIRNDQRRRVRSKMRFTERERQLIYDESIRRALLWKADQ